MQCFVCNSHLDGFDIGCYRKLINRGAMQCMCRNCLAKDLHWERSELDALILRFRQQGCALFPPLNKEE